MSTPYATATFQTIGYPIGATNYPMSSTNYPGGTNNYSLWVTETGVHSGVRNHFFLYAGIGDTNKMAASYTPPSTTNGSYFSYSNTFDRTASNLRNTFYWNPIQFPLLPAAFRSNIAANTLDLSSLQTNHYAEARQRHWLVASNSSISSYAGNTLSFERAPSPDGTIPGEITWYDYPSKAGGDSTLEGSMMLPSFIAWSLPNGESRFINYQRNSVGKVTSQIETYSDTAAALRARTTSYTYSTNLIDLLTITNALSVGVSSNAYNAFHQVTASYNAWGELTSYFYDANHRLTGIIWPSSLITTNFYGSDGYLASTVDIGYRTNSYSYTNGWVYTTTNTLGLSVTNTLDAFGRVLKTVYPDGTSNVNYYVNLDLVATTNRMGFTNHFDYNDFRQVVRRIDELGRTNTLAYCDCGSLMSVADPLNNTTTYTYDYAGRRITTTLADTSWVTNTYDSMNRLTAVTDSYGTTVNNGYNNQGLLVAKSNNIGTVETNQFDILDRLTSRTDVNGVTVTSTYDKLDRISTRTFPDSGVQGYGYTPNFTQPTSYTNFSGAITFNLVTNAYDGLNRKTVEGYPGVTTTTFTYDGAGNVKTLTDGKGQVTKWLYDLYGRVTNKVDGLTNTILVYQYDPNGRLTNRWSTAKGTTSYGYDKVGNLTSVTYPSNPALSFAYDANNRMTNMVDGLGTSSYAYDAVGQLLSEDGPWAYDTVSYSYTNRLRTGLGIAAPDASAWSQSYGYDTVKRLNNVTSLAGSHGYTYDTTRKARIATLTYPNGSIVTDTWESVARLSSTVLNNSLGTTLNSHSYLYDGAGQRTRQTRLGGNYVTNRYDIEGELIFANGYESGGVTNRYQEQFSYVYDAAGNLNSRTNDNLVLKLTQDADNQLSTSSVTGTLTVAGNTTATATTVTVNSSSVTNLYADGSFALRGVGFTNGLNTFTAIAQDSLGRKATNVLSVTLSTNASFTYDGNGNLTGDGRRVFVYDDENQLTSVTVSNVFQSIFVYDGRLRCRVVTNFVWTGGTRVVAGEIHYLYDGMTVVQERDGSNLPRVTYTRGNDLSGSLQAAGGIGGLLARTDHSTALPTHAFYHADGNGNVTALINQQQVIVARYTYDPYGNLLAKSGPLADANTYRFSSKEWQSNAGLYYYGYRFYEPNLQRWVNRDPIEEAGGVNLFGYVENQPVNAIDPVGLQSVDSPCASMNSAILRCDSQAIENLLDAIGEDLSPAQRQAAQAALKRLRTRCGDLIRGNLKKVKDYPSELEGRTYEEILKDPSKKAKLLKKLIQQSPRLKERY